MSTFPKFTRIQANQFNSIRSGMTGAGYEFKNRNKTLSGKFPWIRIFSGAENGLILQSATLDDELQIVDKYKLVKSTMAFGTLGYTERGSYGNTKGSGPIGKSFNNKWVYPSVGYQRGLIKTNTNDDNSEDQDWVLRPSPIVTSLEIKEGKDHISRVGNLVIKCFTLPQLEEIQRYFMEPGFSILIEYGWNDTEAFAQLIDTTDTKTIVTQAADDNLDYDILQNKRFESFGNYDSFFGFIVGGNVTSENENFIVNVNLRGMPGLPTFMQQQKNINIITVTKDATGKVTKGVAKFPSVRLYSVADITPDTDKVKIVSARRYKYMFNLLPPERQIGEVAKMVSKAEAGSAYNYKDLIGFDYNINSIINSYKTIDTIESVGIGLGLMKEFRVGSWIVPREKLGSDYKYINFGLAIRILNANNGLTTYKVGDKEVQVRISPQATIGAFPKIFSTNPTKLVIPGKLPDFFSYFLNDSEVPVDAILNSEFDASIDGISFVQYENIPAGNDPNGNPWNYKTWPGYFEKSGYYGNIENLYVNFDVFCKAIKNSANKSIKDVLLDMLNEMSDAVNSFWNFQLVERVAENGDIEIGIIDENWAGYCPIPKDKIQVFRHSGELSVFLEANLQVDIPSEMTNQIILKRENYTSNPSSHGLDMGGIFTDKKDLFFTGIGYEDNTPPGTAPIGGKTTDALKKDLAALEAQKVAWTAALKSDANPKTWKGKAFKYLRIGLAKLQIIEYRDPSKGNILVYTETINYNPGPIQAIRLAEDPYYNQVGDTTNLEGQKWEKLKADIKDLKKQLESTATTTLTNNINKIDIIANPVIAQMSSGVPATAFQDPTRKYDILRKDFRIYCCTDTQIFDIMKNNTFESYGNVGKTSILLPIKYTFKIMGKSGIRRGDVFNIYGIPERYAENGFFQVINIEQNIEGNLWTTTVTGQYRQHFEK
jgi:hypothetical protein